MVDGDESALDRTEGEHEQLVAIVLSIRRDDRCVYAVNLPNQGTVPGLPDNAVLEIPAVATATGLRPIQMPDFPDALAALLIPKIAAVSLTVDAALSGDRRLFVEALLADGSVADPSVAKRLADELLEAHRQYLPNFF